MTKDKLDVVCVEDNGDLRLIWRKLFHAAGYRLRQFETAETALASIGLEGAPDILITDYFLPDMNGLDLIRRARQFSPLLPSILVTGNREDELGESIASIPGVRYVPKPVKFKLLQNVIGDLLEVSPPPFLKNERSAALDRSASGLNLRE